MQGAKKTLSIYISPKGEHATSLFFPKWRKNICAKILFWEGKQFFLAASKLKYKFLNENGRYIVKRAETKNDLVSCLYFFPVCQTTKK